MLLHSDSVLNSVLRKAAARYDWKLVATEGWGELADGVRAAPASTLLVVDPYAQADPGAGPSVELASLLNRFPSLTVIAATSVRPGGLDDLRRLGAWGVTEVIDLEAELSPWAVAYRLQEARGRPLISLVERVLPTYTSGAARSILRVATQVVVEGGVGDQLAKRLHITSRTLLRWCRKASLPPPRQLLAWLRMLLSAELLDDPGRTVSDAALSCGYASDGSLRNAMRNFLGRSPSELREQGAFDIAAEQFVRVLREARSPMASYRRAKPERTRPGAAT